MILFQSWWELFRVGITAIVAYFLCVCLISIFGKRSSAKMNNFDWIVTVAMGSILGSAVLLKKVVILEVALGLFVLLFMQFLFTKLAVKSKIFKRVMKKSPTLLYFDKEFLSNNMVNERVTREEIEVGVRSKGFVDIHQVMAVVIEPNGELSVLGKPNNNSEENQSLERIKQSVGNPHLP
ncbi:DUF421 domain-containing protein [Salinimonas lutimaris]|uniref:DUF421 domain-containing protein n=1 Tax=Salinimonas lutimaris TaxID=914153 RepID=UPI001E5C3D64|nr:YetF domain-containing protein [Salinimonas lutimaris]